MGKAEKKELAAVPEPSTKEECAAELQTTKEKKEKPTKAETLSEESAKTKEKKTSSKKDKGSKDKKQLKPKIRTQNAIWIGNLPYTVTKDDIRKFFESCGGVITRINLPKKNDKISGFAYVDFDSPEPVAVALTYTEKELGGRPVLIKNATDFSKTGAPSRIISTFQEPASEGNSKSKARKAGAHKEHPPSPTLFVRNLAFEIKKSDLKTIFKPFGELVGVRVATFEDNPEKCKGFAYIDFKYTGDATRALKSPDLKQIKGRRVTIEYASEEATRKGRPWEFDPKYKYANTVNSNNPGKRVHDSGGNSYRSTNYGRKESGNQGYDANRSAHKRARKLETENMAETKLQGLPVQFEGQKITFGED